MTRKTSVKAGGWTNNHNETLVRDLKTKTTLRAGTSKYNDVVLKRGMKMKTEVRADHEMVSVHYEKILWK